MSTRKIKKTSIIFIIVAIIILLPIIVIFSLNLFAWSSIFIGGLLSPNPQKPEITYAEFPFEIVYEIDGETITLKDTYVCEFDGFDWNEGVGKHREWKGYFQSTGEEKFVLLQDGNLSLAVAVGYPEYYMSDPTEYEVAYEPYIYYIIEPNEFGGTSSGVMDIEPILEQYKIKLISWKLSEPIQNSFE